KCQVLNAVFSSFPNRGYLRKRPKVITRYSPVVPCANLRITPYFLSFAGFTRARVRKTQAGNLSHVADGHVPQRGANGAGRTAAFCRWNALRLSPIYRQRD